MIRGVIRAMSLPIKTRLKNSIVASVRRLDFLRNLENSLRIAQWRKAGKPVPPPHAVKQQIVSGYASAFGATAFIETGTYLGDMIYAVNDLFRVIASIELDPDLWKRAKHRFRAYPHVQIWQGDSSELLPQILNDISSNCLFWLDGHYSAGITAKGHLETAVANEVTTILGHKIKGHVILIDDARCFDGTHDYPTLEGLQELVALNRPDYAFSVSNDVIRIHPRMTVQCDF
jgi:hypothetical protein